jgi:hypothetical protein
MSRGAGHPPSPTRITDAAVLARIRNNAVEAACVAVDTDKAPRQNTTVEELAEFALHETRQWTVAFGLPGKKGFQVAATAAYSGLASGLRGR